MYYQSLCYNDYFDGEAAGFEKDPSGVISCDTEFDINPENSNEYDSLSLFFGKKDKHVIKFLKEKGYAEKIVKAEEDPEV